MFSLIARFGPLVAALLGGVALAYPAAGPVVSSVLSVLGLFGAQPDPDLVPDIASLVTGGFLLIGFVRKVYYKYIKPVTFTP